MNINNFIGNLIGSIGEPFMLIRVNIECPLRSGFKTQTKLETSKGTKTIAIPRGLRTLYDFIKEETVRREEKFNKVELLVHSNGEWRASYYFDDELQKITEEKVK